jgi:hypothetical protein
MMSSKRTGLLAMGVAVATMMACQNDRLNGPAQSAAQSVEFSRLDGMPLNASRMAKRRNKGAGCAFVLTDAGGTRGARVERRVASGHARLPFALPAIHNDRTTSRGDGVSLRFVLDSSAHTGISASRGSVAATCWVPNGTTVDALQRLIAQGSSSKPWKKMMVALQKVRPISDTLRKLGISREVKELMYETITADSALPFTRPPIRAGAPLSYDCETGVSPNGNGPRLSFDCSGGGDDGGCDDYGGGGDSGGGEEGGYATSPTVTLAEDPSEVDYPALSIDGNDVTFTANVEYDWSNPYNGGYWGYEWAWNPDVYDPDTDVSSCSVDESAPDQFSCDATVYVSGVMQFYVEDSELDATSDTWNDAAWGGNADPALTFCGGASPDVRDTIKAQYNDSTLFNRATFGTASTWPQCTPRL